MMRWLNRKFAAPVKAAWISVIDGTMPPLLRPAFAISFTAGFLSLAAVIVSLPWIAVMEYRVATYVRVGDHPVSDLGVAVDNMIIALFMMLVLFICLPQLMTSLAVIYRKKRLSWTAVVLNIAAAMLELEIVFIADTTRSGSPLKIMVFGTAVFSLYCALALQTPKIRHYLFRKAV